MRRFLEQRGTAHGENLRDTTANLAVMVRLMPPPRLLLVLAEASLRDAFSHRLNSALLEVDAVADDETAIAMLELDPCHILVTDSLDLVRRIPAHPDERHPVVLVLIDKGDDETQRVQAVQAGADDCIARDVREEELRGRIGLARRIAELETVLRQTLTENRRLLALDELTGVASQSFFEQHFPREVERAARYARPLALVLCDIDHFKRVNDTHGHAAGDELLRQFCARLRNCLRTNVDWIARLGGEEFSVVLPETSQEAAMLVARKLRAAMSGQPFTVEGAAVDVTASFGICSIELVPSDQPKITERLLRAADAALYRSKNAGRNRVTLTSI